MTLSGLEGPRAAGLVRHGGSVIVLGAVLTLWWFASHFGWVSKVFLPTPEAAVGSLLSGMSSTGGLGEDTWLTVQRMLIGWLIASLLGVGIGAVVGMSRRARVYVQPMLEFIRPLPASAVMPFAISAFGLNPSMVLFVVAFGAVWPVMLATAHGMASVEPQLKEVAAAMELGKPAFIWKIGLPNAAPDILAGMRLSLTVALIVSIVGEMLASQAGLGRAVLLAARSFQSSELFAGVVLIGAIGFTSNLCLAAAERRLVRWKTI